MTEGGEVARPEDYGVKQIKTEGTTYRRAENPTLHKLQPKSGEKSIHQQQKTSKEWLKKGRTNLAAAAVIGSLAVPSFAEGRIGEGLVAATFSAIFTVKGLRAGREGTK